MWPDAASLLQLKAGWQEQQVYVWGSTEQGAAVSLIHSILLRANRDELRPNLRMQPVPSLHVKWVPVIDIESGQYPLDANVQPGLANGVEHITLPGAAQSRDYTALPCGYEYNADC